MQRTVFHDFDHFSSAVKEVDCRMMLQNPLERVWSVARANAARVRVQAGELGSGNIVEGGSTEDGFLFYLPASKCTYRINGERLGPGDVAVFAPGTEFCIATTTTHDWCSLTIPLHLLAPDQRWDEVRMNFAAAVAPAGSARIREILGQVLVASHASPRFESSAAARQAECDLMEAAVPFLGKRPGRPVMHRGRPRFSRTEVVACCRRALAEDQPSTVEELVAASGVSGVTLRSVFREYYGIPPATYLRLRQLHLVHRALRAASSEETSVTDVLIRNGVYAFGHFARKYRNLFGESPVETLRR